MTRIFNSDCFVEHGRSTSYVLHLKRLTMMVTCSLTVFSAFAKPIPNLVCTESRIVNVDPRSLKVQESESRTSYRFKNSNLYLKPSDQQEYLYNMVVEVELLRYTTGHKTVQFEGNASEFKSAVVVHSYGDEVRVSRLTCNIE